MADVTGLCLDIGLLIHLFRPIGEFDLPLFIVNTDIFYLLESGYILYDLVDVVPGIQHHGIVSTQLNSISQPFPFHHHVSHGLLFLVFDIEIGPDRETDENDQPNPKDQPKAKSIIEIGEPFQNFLRPNIF